MVDGTYLGSGLLFGALAVVTAVAVVRGFGWRSYRPGFGTDGTAGSDSLATVQNPTTWIVAAVALAVVGVGGALLFVRTGGPPSTVTVVVAPFVAVAGYLVVGVYTTARGRGYHRAQAAMLSAWTVGALLLLAVTATLLGAV
jgi:hypothetical protein